MGFVGGDSVWMQTTKRQVGPPLEGNIVADALVIGGGMCGVLVAHRLKEAGVRVILVEARTVGGGITKNTTAKITAQHGLVYADLIKQFGVERARRHYEANAWAVGQFRTLAERFVCDFEEKMAYVYSVDDKRKLEREATAYRKLGIEPIFQENPPLPFRTAGAIGMAGQAQFHPLKFLYALADGLEIYENTFVSKIDGHKVYTENGIITAKHIVLATHFPMVNIPGLYFMKLHQSRSYVAAFEGVGPVDGMYRDERQGGHSFRTYGDLLFVGGCHGAIQTLAKRTYPHATEKFRWATQDCMTLDGLPYIGRHRCGAKELYVATGFNKWGMTGSMVASWVLTDLIVTGKSELAELYSPQRPMKFDALVGNIVSSAKGLLSIGSPRCSHMGCKLRKNTIEDTWDCPCHGSRFDESGHVIDNPAKKGLRL